MTPVSRGGSMAPVSRGGSTVPIFHGGSVVPVSHGGSVAPVSQGKPPAILTSPALLRSSQINQRVRPQPRPLSRTLSVHNLNDPMQASVPAPPSYDYHADEGGDTEPDDDRDGFSFHQAGIREPEKYYEPAIDEISPDEDERAAEVALRVPGTYTSSNRIATNQTLRKALQSKTKMRKVSFPVYYQCCLTLVVNEGIADQHSDFHRESAQESRMYVNPSYSLLTNHLQNNIMRKKALSSRV